MRPGLVAVVAFLVLEPATMSGNEIIPAKPVRSLSVEVRREIDALALELPAEVTSREPRETFRDLGSWLSQRAPMSLTEELERIRATHGRIQREVGCLPSGQRAINVLNRLVPFVPTSGRPDVGEFELFVLDLDSPLSAPGGQNTLYMSSQTLRAALAEADDSRLAFLLARQLAGNSLRHCRAWYQAKWAKEQVATDTSAGVLSASGDLSDTVLFRTTTVMQEHAEDAMAAHLCRVAGYDVRASLDVIRSEVVDERGQVPDEPGPLATGSLRRLRHVLLELSGVIPDDAYGLHRREAGEWVRVVDGELAEVERAVVLLHGLKGDLDTFDEMLEKLGAVSGSLTILALRFPETGSLFRSSKFLLRELERTGAETSQFDFVGHSAGGLIVRRLVEFEDCPFRTVTLIGTPNQGSDLTSLRPLVEAQQFFSALRGIFGSSMTEFVGDENTQLVRDLEPGSLFLNELNGTAPAGVQRRYSIVRGQALSTSRAMLLAIGVGTARSGLRQLADSSLDQPKRSTVLSWISRLRLPTEVRSGDLAVTLTSATTEVHADVLTVQQSHTKLPEEDQVVQLIRTTIAD